jgi:hypothetical protein
MVLEVSAKLFALMQADRRAQEVLGEPLQLGEKRIHTGVWFQLDKGSNVPGGRLVQFFVEGRLGRGLVEVKEYGSGLLPFPAFGSLVDHSKFRITMIVENTGEIIVLKDGPSKRTAAKLPQ